MNNVIDMRWVGTNEHITAGNFYIADPHVYCSFGRANPSDASCIDCNLPVGIIANEPKGALGYWPDYSNISPNQRANYLTWLASGRTLPLNDIGYVFIFFYGLERRVFIDEARVKPIAAEVIRLLSTYPFSGSFNTYASNFLAYTAARHGFDRLSENWFNNLPESFFKLGGEPLAFAFAWLYANQRPLSPRLAYLFAAQDVRFPQSVVIERLPEQFARLFEKRYAETYGDGMMLRCVKRPLHLFYRPATPSFGNSVNLPPIEIPDVFGIPSQFNKLIDIWTTCIEELKPLSRKLAKGTDVNTRDAYNALPESLREDVDHPDKQQWDTVVNRHFVKEGLALLQVSDIASISGMMPHEKLTGRQSMELAEIANYVGYILVPDTRLSGSTYKWGETVGLFRPKGKPALPSDQSYIRASRILELGIAIAAADGEVTDDEIDHISQFLDTGFSLSPDDMKRLEVYREVLTITPPSIKSLASQLKSNLTKDQLTTICRFLVGVAASDGKIPKDEIKSLKTAYAAFGIDESELYALLNDLSASPDTPVEIHTSTNVKTGELIPPRKKPNEFPEMDTARIKDLIDLDVGSLLGNAMYGNLPENKTITTCVIPNGNQNPTTQNKTVFIESKFSIMPSDKMNQLDSRYHQILNVLVTRDEWTLSEFDSIIRQHSLMPSSTLEIINSWSDEYLGDFLIIEGDSYRINTQILGG